ncbi:hypothetical protein B0H19DRAFT_1175061 [Mycena capillaripes]|nr:hypothetical protein B0H19DRAFT_1175061 [Mycena capillaripes]
MHAPSSTSNTDDETLHNELLWDQNDSEEFYAVHEPEPGLKLLGHAVRGKYYCSTEDECPQAGPHAFPSRRELIQIGDRFYEGDEDDALSVVRIQLFEVEYWE